MATKQADSQKLSTWDKIVNWYAQQAYAVGIVYSVGASVVIIGALFKILHWPGASQVLMIGMFTEAFLFIIGIFEKPHAAYHWENVFPQLYGEEVKEISGGNGIAGGASAPAHSGIEGVSAIADADVKALKDGIANLGKAASQLSSLSEVAVATNGLVEKMNTAGVAAEGFAASQTSLSSAAESVVRQYNAVQGEMEAVVNQTKAYGKGVEALNAQLNSANSVYELQLKEIQAQSAAFRAQTEKLTGVSATIDTLATQANQMQADATATLEASKQYLAGQQKLAAQVADLNKVYGNMLNAL